MSYINLIDKLSAEDKQRIENYISLYGVCKEDFVGLEEWLENWSHANQRLYKLLGSQFIYKIPISIDKPEGDKENEFCRLLSDLGGFRDNYTNFYWDYIKAKTREAQFTEDHYVFFHKLMNLENFITDKISIGIKYKGPGKQRTLQVPAGTKPLRAIQKVVEYFKDDWNWDLQKLEDFRLKHSMILNDDKINTNLCISIHPLDYITMSDNNSNWQSCMNWTDGQEGGCYHVGTIEMMNSNNTLCCYLENKVPYYFSNERDEAHRWNNKRYRVLVHITKDIVVVGKSYPYKNDMLSKKILEYVKDLAKDNLKWTYSFGPELYKDMKYVNSEYPMMRARDYNRMEKPRHHIFIDTNGMYNDILNNHGYSFWCYRNKVAKNKIIQISGKCNCLSCNERIIEDTNECECGYNERFNNTSDVLCHYCQEEHRCDSCDVIRNLEKLETVTIENRKQHICKYCFNDLVKICPCCGEPMLVDTYIKAFVYAEDTKELNTWRNGREVIHLDKWIYRIGYGPEESNKKVLIVCKECYDKNFRDKVKLIEFKECWGGLEIAPVLMNDYPGDAYLYPNLKTANPTEIRTKNIKTFAHYNYCKNYSKYK